MSDINIKQDDCSSIDDLRSAIDVRSIIYRLQRHALGQEEMSNSETAAAKFLLNKILPDMKLSIDNDSPESSRHEELLALLD